jgi:hypothetical protein
MTATSPVLKQIASLPKLSQDELKALWREYFGVEAPAYRRGFLVRGLAHHGRVCLPIDGRQPRELKLAAILGNGPMVWEEQRARSGFERGAKEAHQKSPRLDTYP